MRLFEQVVTPEQERCQNTRDIASVSIYDRSSSTSIWSGDRGESDCKANERGNSRSARGAYALRLELETLAVHLARRLATKSDVDHLESLVDRLTEDGGGSCPVIRF
jgi:hypothetical protein